MPTNIHLSPPTNVYAEKPPKPIKQAPLAISGKATTLGDLVDRFLDRFDRLHGRV